MKIKRIIIPWEDLETLIPNNYYSWMLLHQREIRGIHMYGAFDGVTTAGYALFVSFKAFTDIYSLIYFEIAEDYRGRKIIYSILDTAKSDLQRSGNKDIWVSVLKEDEPFVEDILKESGFRRNYDSQMLIYEVGDLRKSALAEKLEELTPHMNHIKTGSELENKLMTKVYTKDIFKFAGRIDIHQTDLKHLYFFVNNMQIQGHGLFTIPDEEIFFLINYHKKRGKRARLSIPLILSSALSECFNIMKDDASMVLYVNDSLGTAIKSILGEPIESNSYGHYTLKGVL